MAPSSLRSILAYAGSIFSQTPLTIESVPPTTSTVPYVPLSGAPTCPIDGPVSCHNKTAVGDSCCYIYPGGRFLLTQFWDQEVRGNNLDSWTLHGLWPDHCDGTYDQYCRMTPQFKNITEVLQHYEQQELLAFMDRYFVANYGPNSRLWEHEFNKHASCINTLASSCYGDSYVAGVEVVDYFSRATALFRLLDTYYALERAGIVPHPKRHYPLVDVTAALEKFSGGRVVLRCGGGGRGSRRDSLHEVWFVYHMRGSLQAGDFIPAQDLGKEGDAANCPPWVRYMPKARGLLEL